MERQKDYMENPYIGKDGRDYHTFEALEKANAEYFAMMFPKIENLPHPTKIAPRDIHPSKAVPMDIHPSKIDLSPVKDLNLL